MRMLIADDHEVIRRTVIRILTTRADIEYAEAENGKEAVEKALELKPDLIVLDVKMPVLSGFEAAQEIKQHLPGTPILFFSIHDTSEILEDAKAIGQGIVLKEQAGRILLQAVDALLRKETFFPLQWSDAKL